VDVHLDPTLNELLWDRLCEIKGQMAQFSKINVAETQLYKSEDNSQSATDSAQPSKAEQNLTINKSRTHGENLRKQINQSNSFIQAL
jgi:hypothetical protein